ncbi:hypothetical protein VTL71DRAFT_5579 [Oculimacula yallundae]|uniref:Uncharacterized protein n=1 Tax=Oculimacula yallundae TaxID=86028 RepID=A0ABR4C1I3_9HELO
MIYILGDLLYDLRAFHVHDIVLHASKHKRKSQYFISPKTMGGVSSTQRSRAEIAQDRYLRKQRALKKAEKRRLERERKRLEKAEREVWMRDFRSAKGKEDMVWWNAAWWPLYAWLQEKSAWEKEVKRRKGMGYNRIDDIVLKDHVD